MRSRAEAEAEAAKASLKRQHVQPQPEEKGAADRWGGWSHQMFKVQETPNPT